MKSALVIGIFLVGCVTGGVASKFVAPPASAGANFQTWEYWCFSAESGDAGHIQERANWGGAQGWEMAAAAGAANGDKTDDAYISTFCFKRLGSTAPSTPPGAR